MIATNAPRLYDLWAWGCCLSYSQVFGDTSKADRLTVPTLFLCLNLNLGSGDDILLDMEDYYDKIDRILSIHNLKCYRSGCSGQKIQIIGIEGSGFDFTLYFTWKGEIILNNFDGSIRISDFCEILMEIDKEIKGLII